MKRERSKRRSRISAQQLQRYKKQVVAALEGGHSLSAIARALKVARQTIWRWRHADEAFDENCRAAIFVGDNVRTQMVEDRFYKDLIHGRCSPAERIFYLCNRDPERWVNLHKIDPALRREDKIPLAWAQEAVARMEARIEAARARRG